MKRSIRISKWSVPMLSTAMLLSGFLLIPASNTFAQAATPDFEATDVPPPAPPKPKPAPTTSTTTTTTTTTSKPKPPPPPPPPPISVDIELVMLVDVSSSVDDTEFALQRLGYVNAFRDPEIQQLIASREGVAVNVTQWSGNNQQWGTGWYLLYTAADCEAFADRVANEPRRYSRDTVMARAISTARWMLRSNSKNGAKIEGVRQIIDVSGDGVCENWYYYETGTGGTYSDGTSMGDEYYGWRWNDMYNHMNNEGFIINGISIGANPELKAWYAANVPLGEFSFAMHADTFEAFGTAIKQKLLRELSIPTTQIDTAYD